jgi:glyoxylase-like metal-dependent hydrolase (beta-lactamase superfamily II)
MSIHFLNCFTCNARVPASLRSGTLCLLIETDRGPVLVDTGPGQADYARPPAVLRAFQALTIVPMDPQQTAVRQVASLGYAPEDVRHIALTHMHFDHCGGLPDFPRARVHVHRREREAFSGRPRRWTDLAYVRRHLGHGPEWALYEESGERWFDWPAVRLPFDPEMWLVPLFGHTCGHCGVAVRTPSGWLFHAGDAAPMGLSESVPGWLVRAVLGPHAPRLRAFQAAHPEVRMTTGHMWLNFFEGSDPDPTGQPVSRAS